MRRSRGVGFEEARLRVLVVDGGFDAAHQQRRTERACAALLGELLDVVRDGLGERVDADGFAVAQAVGLCPPTAEVHEAAGVGDVTRAGDADVVVYLVEFLDTLGFEEGRADVFSRGQDDAVPSADADADAAAANRFAGVLDLIQSAVGREDVRPAVVGLLLLLRSCRHLRVLVVRVDFDAVRGDGRYRHAVPAGGIALGGALDGVGRDMTGVVDGEVRIRTRVRGRRRPSTSRFPRPRSRPP